jgi:hypothetical protein
VHGCRERSRRDGERESEESDESPEHESSFREGFEIGGDRQVF